MKTLIAALALMALPALAAPVGVRAQHTQARITHGVATGQLNHREAARLQAQQNHLTRELARDRRDGGGLSLHERAKLQRQENQLSRRITAQKHDGQVRY